MDNERIDLSALDLRADRLRHERLVREIRRRAAPELTRRAMERSLAGQLAAWARPLAVAASVIGLLSATTLLMTDRGAVGGPQASGTTGAAVLLDEPDWLLDDPLTTVPEIILAFGGDIQ